jgi:superfamily I DNA/RNA helicase
MKKANVEQQKAIECPKEGNTILLAGAGTGKTFTLIARIAYLQKNCQINPSQILCLTFTRAAALEMKTRLSALNASVGFIGTFHSFAYQYLKNKDTSVAEIIPHFISILKGSLLARLQKQYPYILVDEFQDTDPLQINFLENIKSNLFLVGDDYQAIYGFRGAEPEWIRNAPIKFNAQIIKLENNYRSSPNVLQWVNRVFVKDDKKFRKKLLPNSPNRGVSKWYHFATSKEELNWILVTCKEGPLTILCRYNRQVKYYQNFGTKNNINNLQIMTIHASKGLEFVRVAVVGLSKTLFPNIKRNQNPKKYAEEKRLFYVAMSRAQKDLYLLSCEQKVWKGKLTFFRPSPFLRITSPLAPLTLRIKSL